jgi:sn-glycerol 3-phosphate transport system permease protein
MLVSPLVVLIFAALIGAASIAWLFRQTGLRLLISAAIGLMAGFGGALIFMLPLNFCTFELERPAVDLVFGLLLIAAGLVLTLSTAAWLIRRWQGPREPQTAAHVSQPGSFRGKITPWLLLAPTLVILALFLYYPSLDTFSLSTQLARLGARRSAFVCVDNFTRLVTDQSYLNSLGLTLLMSAAIVVIGLSLSLLIALAAYQPVKGARVYRTLLIWPYAISPAVAGVIFLLLFNPAGGIINYLLNGIGLPSIPWLNNPVYAPWAVILASVWKSMGFNILFYIAGLQNVPKDLQEAAAIDGANAVQRFRHVVLPLLSPITFFLIITNMTYAFFETFGTIDYLTAGGPLSSTTTLMYRIYYTGIQNNDLGKAAAQSIILFVMVISLTVLQFRSTGRRVTYGA